MMQPIDIKSQSFGTGLFGYKKNDVDQYVDTVYRAYDELFTENKNLREEKERLNKLIEESNLKIFELEGQLSGKGSSDSAADTISKNDRIAVEGRLQINTLQAEDGTEKKVMEIDLSSFEILSSEKSAKPAAASMQSSSGAPEKKIAEYVPKSARIVPEKNEHENCPRLTAVAKLPMSFPESLCVESEAVQLRNRGVTQPTPRPIHIAPNRTDHFPWAIAIKKQQL